MKKFLIICAAVAVAMTACNKKPADDKALNKDAPASPPSMPPISKRWKRTLRRSMTRK